MSVEFSQAGRGARERIETPPAPLGRIRHRAGTADRRQRVALASLLAAFVFAGISVGTGAAQRAYEGIRVWISGSTGTIQVHSLAMTQAPMAGDIRAIAGKAAFRAVFPTGLPRGTQILWVGYSPAEHPTVIAVSYAPPRGRTFSVTLVKTNAISHGVLPDSMLAGTVTTTNVSTKIVGDETVVTLKNHPLPPFVLWSASQAESEKATEALAAPMRILGARPNDVRDVLQAAAGAPQAVVIGTQFTPQIPKLAAAGKPMLDQRTVLLTDIATVKGAPDYKNATYHWPKSTAVTPAGVRALNSKLLHHPCRCTMLLVPASGGYTVRQFDRNGKPL